MNGGTDNMGVRQGDVSRSTPPNPPLRGRVGPAEEPAPAYSSVMGASTNGTSGKTIKSRSGGKGAKSGRQNNDQFDSDNDVNDHESEFASEEDGDFR